MSLWAIGFIIVILTDGMRVNLVNRMDEMSPKSASDWFRYGFSGGGSVNGTEYSEKACYEEALKHDPTYALAWHNLGRQGGGSVNGTEYSKKACYEEALKHDPTYALAWKYLGVQEGGSVNGTEYSEKACYEEALKHDPTHALAWNNLGVQGGGSVNGKEYSGKACYEEALKHDPTHALAWNNLGVQGGGSVNGTEYSEKACYEEALKHDPTHTLAWNNLGVQGGGSVNGREYLQKACYEEALKHDPTDPTAWNNLGRQGGGSVSNVVYSEEDCYTQAVKGKEIQGRTIDMRIDFDSIAVKDACKPFVKSLVETCISNHERPSECNGFIFNAYHGITSLPDVFYRMFLQPLGDLAAAAKVFWTGFSHTRGTRPAVDSFRSIVGGQDIESNATNLGLVMRGLRWGRDCHKTGDDKRFWKLASQVFAARKGKGHTRQFYLLNNYADANLMESFLYKYEVPLIHYACKDTEDCRAIVVDFHGDCGEAIKKMIQELAFPSMCMSTRSEYKPPQDASLADMSSKALTAMHGVSRMLAMVAEAPCPGC